VITVSTPGGFVGICDLIRVDFGLEASVTEHPVEIGSEVTDHVQKRPVSFTAEAYVSDSPRASSTVTLRNTRAATDFFEGLIGQLCTVVIASEGTFNNFVLESLSHSRSGVLGRAYTLRFKQIRMASALSVEIPPRLPAPVASVGAPTEQSTGQQAPVPVAPPPVESTAYAGAAALAALVF